MGFTASLLIVFFICVFVLAFDQVLDTTGRKPIARLSLKSLPGFLAKYADSILLFIAAFAVIYLFNNHKYVIYNNYSYLADSILHGRLDIPDMPSHLESVTYNGKTYMHFAPGPALLVLPFIAIWREHSPV